MSDKLALPTELKAEFLLFPVSDANVNEILMAYWNTSKSYVIKNQYVLHKKNTST
jgi:hypothetical protein